MSEPATEKQVAFIRKLLQEEKLHPELRALYETIDLETLDKATAGMFINVLRHSWAFGCGREGLPGERGWERLQALTLKEFDDEVYMALGPKAAPGRAKQTAIRRILVQQPRFAEAVRELLKRRW